ncbi:MAG: peroxiredoxin-like family protein [Bdellovibrionota bacterium]
MKNFYRIILLTLLLSPPFSFAANKADKNPPSTLTQELQALADKAKAKSTPEKAAIMNGATEKLRKSEILKNALKMGDKIPAFSLPDSNGKEISTTELLKKGPIVLTFYRGAWCPYCNLQLNSLQSNIEAFHTLGAEVVAISPQTPDNSLSTVQKNSLDIIVLSDVGSVIGKKFGLVFKLPDDLKKLYQSMGLDLAKANGNNDWELPVAASYVVNPQGIITYSFMDVDYKKRAETLTLIEEVKKISIKK